MDLAQFSPGGDHILTASQDGAARLCLTHDKDLLELADERITREFTTKELERYGELMGIEAEGK